MTNGDKSQGAKSNVGGDSGRHYMTPSDASRIQAQAAKEGKVEKGSFAARAQGAAAKNVNAGKVDKK